MMALAIGAGAVAQKVEWIATTEMQPWKLQKPVKISKVASTPADVVIKVDETLQRIDGFGPCFNELGWTSLNLLNEADRDGILREMFAPGVGGNFTICRIPVGANDFSRNWYSYNEADGDFEMKHFSVANDIETLIPFIKSAQKHNPGIRIWASPWSPPTWMKYNRHYAARSVLGNTDFQSEEFGMDLRGINNGLPKYREGQEGTDMFIQEEKYFRAYALYFRKFIEAYREQKINVAMVMPQNEFNSAQVFPSCTWTSAGLGRFLSYLAPEMKSLGVDVFFGTMERANEMLVDSILTDPVLKQHIKGVGFQWAGKGAIPAIHKKYPGLTLYQTEQECGNSKNDWKYAVYSWGLMKHYLSNGANAYMYWNLSLKQGGISTWGWKQNSLVTVDPEKKTFHYNHEYFLLKHFSHYIHPGAKRLATSGSFENALAFVNPDSSIVIVAYLDSAEDKGVRFTFGGKTIHPVLKANSFNTIHIKLRD